MYARAPTAAELEGTGFTIDDYADDEPIELWPENERAINLFTSLSTQWRIGMSGATGLDYSPFFTRMDRMRLSDDDYEILFDDIRIIESEALQIMNKKTD